MGWFYHNPVPVYAGLGVVNGLASHLAGFRKVLLLTSPGMVRRGSAAWLMQQVEQGKAGASGQKSGCAHMVACENEVVCESEVVWENTAIHGIGSACEQQVADEKTVGARQNIIASGKNITSENNLTSEQSISGQQTPSQRLPNSTSTSRRIPVPTLDWLVETMGPNPDVVSLEAMAKKLYKEGLEAIVAFGGGSVMDSAKVLAVALANSGCPIRYFFRHHNDEAAALPYYCIPTTSGTGAEMTPFGTVWDKEARKKHSFSARNLFARAAFLDPATTISLPPKETLYGAMDAMSHALETLWNRNASIIGQSLARNAIEVICRAYPLVAREPGNHAARLCLQEASALAGMAISQSRSALAHSMSYPLTSHFGVPHGLACSFTLSAIARLVTEKDHWRSAHDKSLAMKAVEFMDRLGLAAHVAEYYSAGDIFALAGEMFAPGRVENFIVPVTSEEVLRILRESVAY